MVFDYRGGTAVLGAVLFSGMFSYQPKRGLAAMIALFAVAALGTVFAIYVSRPPSAPVVPPERGGTEKAARGTCRSECIAWEIASKFVVV